MDIKLTFALTLVSGETTTQEISAPADPQLPVDRQALAVMQSMLHQYATVGMLRQPEAGHFMLLCPSQIASVECRLPSIVLASPGEAPPSGR